MAKRRSKAARAFAARLGWVGRRALAAGKSKAHAQNGFRGYVRRLEIAAARAKATPRRPAKAKAPQRGADGSLTVYAAPRSPDGIVEPQPAIGVGSVTADIISGAHKKTAKPGLGDYTGVTGLQTVRVQFLIEDDADPQAEPVPLVREFTVLIPERSTTAERERIIARAVVVMTRTAIGQAYERGLSGRGVAVDTITVFEAVDRMLPTRAPRRLSRAKGAGVDGKPKFVVPRAKPKARSVSPAQRARATGKR